MYGPLKKGKPKQWAFDQSRTDPQWSWFWDKAAICLPLWERGGNPRCLATGDVWTPNNASNPPIWTVGPAGTCFESTNTTDHKWLSPRDDDEMFSQGDDIAIFVIYEKTDATNRDSTLFGYNNGAGVNRLMVHGPYSSGTTYWDHDNSSTGRVSVASLDYSSPVCMSFIASTNRGQAIYRNNVVSVSGTKDSRTLQSCKWGCGGTGGLNGGLSGPDLIKMYFFAAFDAEVTYDEMKRWFEDPYGPIRDAGPKLLPGDANQPIESGAAIRNRWAGQGRRY